jgi:hypothetical protein
LLVPPERIHVVTVPQPGGDPQLLLKRFCQVVEVDPGSLTVDAPPRNDSLGHVQAELLRRVNEALDPELRRRDVHGPVAKRYFAGQILRQQQGAPAKLHVRHRQWCDDLARGYVADLRAAGFDVVGDLDELLPAATSYTQDDVPVDDTLVARAATDALAAILTKEADRREAARARRAEQARAQQHAELEAVGLSAKVRRRLGRLVNRLVDRWR